MHILLSVIILPNVLEQVDFEITVTVVFRKAVDVPSVPLFENATKLLKICNRLTKVSLNILP